MSENQFDPEKESGSPTREEALIDQFVTDTCVMDARLGDHLLTLDTLRDTGKNNSLAYFGFSADLSEHEGSIRSFVASHLERYDDHMAGYLRYAHLVLTYIILEDRLCAFGKTMHAINRGAPFDPDRHKSKGGSDSTLARFDRYLQVCSILPPANEEVESLRLIRNCIVHANGRVSGLKKEQEARKVRDMLPALAGVTLDCDGYLKITTEGCLVLQEGMMRYLRSLFDAVDFHIWMPADIFADGASGPD